MYVIAKGIDGKVSKGFDLVREKESELRFDNYEEAYNYLVSSSSKESTDKSLEEKTIEIWKF